MWWDDSNDSADWQILKNMTFLKFWGTNEERDNLFNSPFFAVIAVIFIIAIIGAILYATGVF